MRKSFYTWLMTQRNAKTTSATSQLAGFVFEETTFPKHSTDFETISRYLEDEASFSFNLSDFDKIWEEYLAH
ncbi:YozE family protein [Streptococcus sciuri]|uniref:UPF0346 protein NXS10_06965 n=1 Tax=Streptococcus sciuri TaxID=2973939 RepID=A0ABT2F8E0_9STRE|nr:YozE family protein [Streptococcus sciuri]MCS4488694.1 YozE family protein [Streptococcus sciuri]